MNRAQARKTKAGHRANFCGDGNILDFLEVAGCFSFAYFDIILSAIKIFYILIRQFAIALR
jgi:hypothetical protein